MKNMILLYVLMIVGGVLLLVEGITQLVLHFRHNRYYDTAIEVKDYYAPGVNTFRSNEGKVLWGELFATSRIGLRNIGKEKEHCLDEKIIIAGDANAIGLGLRDEETAGFIINKAKEKTKVNIIGMRDWKIDELEKLATALYKDKAPTDTTAIDTIHRHFYLLLSADNFVADKNVPDISPVKFPACWNLFFGNQQAYYSIVSQYFLSDENVITACQKLININNILKKSDVKLQILLLPFAEKMPSETAKNAIINKMNYHLGMNNLIADDMQKVLEPLGKKAFQCCDNRHLSVEGQQAIADYILKKDK